MLDYISKNLYGILTNEIVFSISKLIKKECFSNEAKHRHN
ncbi:conserved hypothetical protein [Bacillus mycoides]|uniref:Uncharacterized protein n=1 Tax=Bacillus mycoides TaxID=1405 RepID=A0A653VSK9_BACMY|nr:conserved hypothetical protein [Bacillus mycoides]